MREKNGLYEYIGVYVDDLLIISKAPQVITDMLEEKHKFKLKGTGEITFHLGCDFFRDDDGTLCMAPKKCIEKLIDGYHNMFREKPKTRYKSPLESGDHPEMDHSKFLGEDGVQKYQSLIGSIQWAVSIGRLDVATAVMTLSGYRSIPRQGHLERTRRVIRY